MTTTPESVTTKPALGLPSEPLPVSPTTAYTPGARSRGAEWPDSRLEVHATDAAQRTIHQRERRGATSNVCRREPLGPSARKRQALAKLMLTECLNVAPLLSVQTIVRGASFCALSVKLTTGSRLIPDVQSNRATSSPPYVTTTCLMK